MTGGMNVIDERQTHVTTIELRDGDILRFQRRLGPSQCMRTDQAILTSF